MPSPLFPNAPAPSSARLARERRADGVVAGYIRELSRPARVAADSAPRDASSRRAARDVAVSRVRAARRRRSHGPAVWRPLTAQPGGPSA